MIIPVVKEADALRSLSSFALMAENITLELKVKNPNPWDLAQLESVFSEDQEDWGNSVNALRLSPLHLKIRK